MAPPRFSPRRRLFLCPARMMSGETRSSVSGEMVEEGDEEDEDEENLSEDAEHRMNVPVRPVYAVPF